MCSINGFIRLSNKGDVDAITHKMIRIIRNGTARGKDSYGFVCFNQSSDGDVHVESLYKEISNADDTLVPFKMDLDSDVKILMNNNRAEPTTEFIDRKTLADVQPFQYKQTWIVHNGTIANDKEIIQKSGLEFDSEIDSIVIPYVLSKATDIISMKECIFNLVGSYALGIYQEGSDKFYLATNYKPLSLQYDNILDTLFFSSLPEYIIDQDDMTTLYNGLTTKEIPPYTLLEIDLNTGRMVTTTLRNDFTKTKKALICASAGMDSTVAATWAKDQGYDVSLLQFQYHCRAGDKEAVQIQKIAEYLECEVVTIQTDFFRDVIKGSRLVENNSEIIKEGDKGAELAYEWVPARNLIFLSIATGYAEAHDFDYIVLGGNLEESGAYPDNELIFQTKFNDVLPYSVNLNKKVEILTPVANCMKRDIVKMGLELGAPLHLTWSCYEDGEKHCGECGPCFMRKTAFKMLGENEVIEYLNDKKD